MTLRDRRVNALAHTLLSGPRDVSSMQQRAAHLFGRTVPGLLLAVTKLSEKLESGHVRSLREVVAFLASRSALMRALRVRDGTAPRVQTPSLDALPSDVPWRWEVPPLSTLGDLAAWLDVPLNMLSRHVFLGRTLRTTHWHYRVELRTKRDGSLRILEVPSRPLCAMQRRILHGILDCVPAHDAAWGFVKGRDVHGYVAPHVGRRWILRTDLREFFPTIGFVRVRAVFHAMGYPNPVAVALASLCTRATDARLWTGLPAVRTEGEAAARRSQRELFARAHLPQGAPTSPSLANLAAYRMDVRLFALARSYDAVYTRYADDLAFSGEVSRPDGLFARVCEIVASEGFGVHPHKTRVMWASQRQELAGVVVNAVRNIRRTEYDGLKAQLHKAMVWGPVHANAEGVRDLRSVLLGRIAWVTQVHPARGARLREMFERIAWTEES